MPGLNLLLPGVPEGPEERRCLDEGEFNLLGVVVGVLLCGWTGGAVDFLAVGCLAFLRALAGMGDFLTAWFSFVVEWMRNPELLLPEPESGL